MIIPKISGNFSQVPTNDSESGISKPLQALIIVVSTVAATILGFFLSGPAGLAIGGIAGAGLGFTAIWLNNPEQEAKAQGKWGSDLVIPDIREASFGSGLGYEYIDGIQWMYGTQSIMLSFILAAYRQTNLSKLEVPALMPNTLWIEHQITPPLTSYPDDPHRDVIIGTRDLDEGMSQTTGNLRKTFTQAALDNLWFNPLECDLITNSFPLIFASTLKELNARRDVTVIKYPMTEPRRIETLHIDRPLLLGRNRDIQIIYTARENIDRVKTALGLLAAEVEVLDVENPHLF